MSWLRLWAVMRKEFLQILRDRNTLYIVLAIPVVQLFLLGYTATTEVRNIPLAVIDRDRTSDSRRLLDAYRAADYFRLAFDVDSEDQLRQLIDGGEAGAGLIIPADFSEQLRGGGRPASASCSTARTPASPQPLFLQRS
jgi:ABC-2 type transport system permease protein